MRLLDVGSGYGDTLRAVARHLARLGVAAEGFDGIVCSLFAHHLEDAEIVPFLKMMETSARGGWFVNDLYRSRFAATGFAAIARLTGRHPIVRHDGPVSFARAFRREDWRRLLSGAGVEAARIGMDVPFRLCVERLHV